MAIDRFGHLEGRTDLMIQVHDNGVVEKIASDDRPAFYTFRRESPDQRCPLAAQRPFEQEGKPEPRALPGFPLKTNSIDVTTILAVEPRVTPTGIQKRGELPQLAAPDRSGHFKRPDVVAGQHEAE